MMYLEKGWNLVSFYFDDINFDNFLNNDSIIEIKNLNQYYNKTLPKELNSLNKLNLNSGYWINTNKSTVVEVCGILNKSTMEVELNKGWNLVNYPFKLKSSILDIDLNNILEIKNNKETFNSTLPNEFNTLTTFKSNQGYWFNLSRKDKVIFKYPFKHNQPTENFTIKDLIVSNEIEVEDITKVFEVDNYCIEINENSIVDLPWINGNDDISIDEMRDLIKKLNGVKFSIYYGYWNNKILSVGIDFKNEFQIFSGYSGDLTIIPSEYNDLNKFVEIKIGNRENDKIIFDIEDNIITIKYKNSYCFLKNINFQKINSDNTNDNFFLCDYNFEKINIDKIFIQKNNSILSLKSINYKYNTEKKYLQINIIDNNSVPIILYVKKLFDKTKKVSLDISFIDNNLENQKILILHNKTFNFKLKNDQYNINLEWSGPKNYENKYIANKFSDNSEYLYWYNLKNINIESIEFNKKIVSYEINDSSKDYLIFNIDSNNTKYFVYIVKSMNYFGCVEISIKNPNNNNINMTYTIEALHNNQIIYIDDNSLKIKWEGLLDNNGYQIKNISDELQRDIGKSLNTFELFTHNSFTYKIHYFIGLDNNSINLNEWDSYYNYLDILKRLLSYCLDYISLLNLRLPLNDINLIKNGGGPSYDIYVLDKETKVINNGNYYYTENYFDKVTYLILSNKLSYGELKSKIFQNIFHTIVASYNWYNEKWISDGLSILFEYLINDYNKITLEEHIELFKNQNLSISNNGNATIDNDFYIQTRNTNNLNILNNKICLYIDMIYTENNEYDFNDNIIPNLELKSSNDTSIYINDIQIINENNKNILKIELDSNRHIKFMKFKLYFNSELVTNIKFTHEKRGKSSFIFFYYLLGIYGNKIFDSILKISEEFSHYKCIDNYLNNVNPSSTFTKVLIDFWTAINILSNDSNVDKKFRLANSKDIKSLINIENDSLIVNNFNNVYKLKYLENTGSKCYDVIFNNTIKGNIQFSGNFPVNKLHKRILIEYYDNQLKVLEIEPSNNINIEINNSVKKVKLLLVADKDFIDNEEITITTENIVTH